jgi:hypothetical protein
MKFNKKTYGLPHLVAIISKPLLVHGHPCPINQIGTSLPLKKPIDLHAAEAKR